MAEGRNIDYFMDAYRRKNPEGNFFDRDRLKREGIRLSEVTVFDDKVIVSGKECYKISVLQGGRGTGRRCVYFDCVTMQEVEGEEEKKRKKEKIDYFIEDYLTHNSEGDYFNGVWRSNIDLLSYSVILDKVPCYVVYNKDRGIYTYFTEEGYKFVCEKPAALPELPSSPVALRVGQRIELSGHYMDSYNGRYQVMRESGDGGYIIRKENRKGELKKIGDKNNGRIMDEIRNYKRSIFYDPIEERKLREELKYYPDERRWPFARLEGEPVKSERIFEHDRENGRIKIL